MLMNLLTPVFGDDYAYSFIWDGSQNGNFQNNIGKLERLESIGDIFVSQWSHYFTWGGRTIAHLFVQFFCLTGKLFFDIMNGLCYAALALIIYFLAAGKVEFQNLNGKIFIWIFFALWFCLPEFFQTTLWMTGACNYLWMSVLQLTFLIPFVLKFWGRENFLTKVPIMAALGLVAGWSNESGGAMIIFLTFLFLLYFWQQKKLERWMLAGFIILFVGYALLMLAPGNVHRFEIDSDVTEESLFTAQMFLDNFNDGMIEIIIYDAILFLPIIGYFLRGKKLVAATQLILVFTAAGVLLPCLLMFSPEFPVRAAFDSPIFLIIASVIELKQTPINLPQKIISAALCVWLVTITYALAVDWSVHSQMAARHEYIDEHKNDALIVVEPIYLPAITEKIYWAWTMNEYSRFYGDLTPYRDKFNNRNITYAQYYGIKEIILNEESFNKLTQFIFY